MHRKLGCHHSSFRLSHHCCLQTYCLQTYCLQTYCLQTYCLQTYCLQTYCLQTYCRCYWCCSNRRPRPFQEQTPHCRTWKNSSDNQRLPLSAGQRGPASASPSRTLLARSYTAVLASAHANAPAPEEAKPPARSNGLCILLSLEWCWRGQLQIEACAGYRAHPLDRHLPALTQALSLRSGLATRSVHVLQSKIREHG